MISSCDFRVYYEDTDAGGVVYYANYLKFAERARTEMLRQCGIDQSHLLIHEQLCFVVRRVTIDYLSPARLDDLVSIYTEVMKIGGASLQMQQKLQHGDRLLAKMDVLVVAVNSTSMKPCKIPEKIRKAFAYYLNLSSM